MMTLAQPTGLGLMPVTKTQLESFAVVDAADALVALARDATTFPVYRPSVPAGA